MSYAMRYSLGIEQVEPGKWLAWIFELPGCFARGSSRDNAIRHSPRAIADYFNWRDGYQRVTDEAASQLQVTVVEEFDNYETLDGYWVNSFFEYDRRIVSHAEMDDVRWLLSCTRSDLVSAVRRVPASDLDHPLPDERFGSVLGILSHVATAENWYLNKLGLGYPKSELAGDAFGLLDQVRRRTVLSLSRLADKTDVREVHGELWSSRKIVRRMLWHERVHTWHIQRHLAGVT